MRSLVTGVAGFIGSSLADKLLGAGHDVVGVDCFVDYYSREIKEKNLQTLRDFNGFTFSNDELAEVDIVEKFGEFDLIFHQAAQAGVRASWGEYFDSYTRNNILATQRLLESLKSHNLETRVIYASSSSIYGNAEQFPTPEDIIPAPVSPYGVTKLAAENLMRLYATEFGVHTVSLRYFTVYGPRQRPDMAFHRFCKAAILGNEISLYGDGEQSRDFTYIDDVVDANILASKHGSPGSVYNIGGGEVVTINQMLKELEELVSKPLRIRRCERQAGDARRTSADTSRAREDLSFSPRITVSDGLKKELAWIAHNIDLLGAG